MPYITRKLLKYFKTALNKLGNSNYFTRTHMGDFPKLSHKCYHNFTNSLHEQKQLCAVFALAEHKAGSIAI